MKPSLSCHSYLCSLQPRPGPDLLGQAAPDHKCAAPDYLCAVSRLAEINPSVPNRSMTDVLKLWAEPPVQELGFAARAAVHAGVCNNKVPANVLQ